MPTKNPNRVPDITGTRDDNTMHIEGEGAAELGGTQTHGNEALVQRSQDHNDRRSACEKYGHLPKMYEASDDKWYEVSPRVCRTCSQPY